MLTDDLVGTTEQRRILGGLWVDDRSTFTDCWTGVTRPRVWPLRNNSYEFHMTQSGWSICCYFSRDCSVGIAGKAGSTRCVSKLAEGAKLAAARHQHHLPDVGARSRAGWRSCSAGPRPWACRLLSPPTLSASMIKR